nr:unnamed protein product [Digitaria exilis]
MAGGDGSSLRRCTAESLETAAGTAGPQGSLKSCSSKRKAKKEPAASSGGRVLRPRRPTGRKAKEHAASATAAEAETEVAAGAAVQNRLSAKEIRWILCQKAQPPPPPYQALKRSNPELTPRPGEEDDEEKMTMYVLARAFYELEERLPKMQEKVRSELKNKGYVEVDDEYHKCKAEAQAVIDREWPKLVARFKDLGLSEASESSDEEEEEVEEGVAVDLLD